MHLKQILKSLFLFFMLFTLCMPTVFSHSGRTDSNGGHWDRSTGTYHYHSGEYANKSNKKKSSEQTKEYSVSKYGDLDETIKAVRKYNEENSYLRKAAKAAAEYRRTYKNTDKNTEELTPLPESLVKKYNIKVPEEYKSKQLEPKSDFQRQVDNVRARQNAQFVEISRKKRVILTFFQHIKIPTFLKQKGY